MTRLTSERCALLLIDMQKDFCAPGGYADQAGLDISALRAPIAGLQRLLAAARNSGWLIIHTREGHRADLSDLSPAKRARGIASGAPIGSQGPLGRLLVRGEPGHDLIEELYPRPGEPVIDKPGYSAFAHTDLELILRNRGISQLLVGGVTSEVCVSTSVRHATDLGFSCFTLSDGSASGDAALHAAALEMVAVEGGIFGQVLSIDQALAAMEGEA
jgi:nicotinamidase-related amidase